MNFSVHPAVGLLKALQMTGEGLQMSESSCVLLALLWPLLNETLRNARCPMRAFIMPAAIEQIPDVTLEKKPSYVPLCRFLGPSISPSADLLLKCPSACGRIAA